MSSPDLRLHVVAEVEQGHHAGVLRVNVQAPVGQKLLHRLVNAPQLLPTLENGMILNILFWGIIFIFNSDLGGVNSAEEAQGCDDPGQEAALALGLRPDIA